MAEILALREILTCFSLTMLFTHLYPAALGVPQGSTICTKNRVKNLDIVFDQTPWICM